MKIKTFLVNTDHIEEFDNEVNKLLDEGWYLSKREVLPGMQYNANNWARRALYAELVLLDPPAEPEAVDPFKALHQVKEFCRNVPAADCNSDRCPLAYWCDEMRNGGGDPTDWVLPEVDA